MPLLGGVYLFVFPTGMLVPAGPGQRVNVISSGMLVLTDPALTTKVSSVNNDIRYPMKLTEGVALFVAWNNTIPSELEAHFI